MKTDFEWIWPAPKRNKASILIALICGVFSSEIAVSLDRPCFVLYQAYRAVARFFFHVQPTVRPVNVQLGYAALAMFFQTACTAGFCRQQKSLSSL